MKKDKTKVKYIKRDGLIAVVFLLLTIAGLVCLLYPTASDVVNTINETKAIHLYKKEVDALPTAQYQAELKKAQEYNEKLNALNSPLFEADLIEGYYTTLNIDGNDIIGVVNIPQIDINLPIYHGTDEKALGNAVGHLQGSSFPVGGENTHAVIAAHCGINNARLFTDIDTLKLGDEFTVTVLNKELTYEVDNIQVVLPEETTALEIIKGGDYCTLQTCTPYGINSHRLLVRGKHTKTTDIVKKRTEDASWEETVTTVITVLMNKRNIAPVIAAVSIMLVFVAIRIVINVKRNKRQRGEKL